MNILGNLDGTEDKGTLASCMRVSPTFNRVAAPMLYHSITVPSGNNHPLAIPARSRYVKRSTPTKITNLDRVQGITIQRHWQDCEAVLGRTYSPFPPPIRIKWVRFENPDWGHTVRPCELIRSSEPIPWSLSTPGTFSSRREPTALAQRKRCV